MNFKNSICKIKSNHPPNLKISYDLVRKMRASFLILGSLLAKYGKADVVTAFNVFAHSDGLKEILYNTENLLKKNGEFVFEIQYLLRTLKDLTFDNVYHEHVNYWCLHSLLSFFEDSKMKIYKVKEVDTHGGSIRVYATKNPKKRVHKSVAEYIQLEEKNKLNKIATYYQFAKDVESIKDSSLKKINNWEVKLIYDPQKRSEKLIPDWYGYMRIDRF